MDPRAIFRALAEREVRYVLVGGLAATAHGASLATFDIDLCFQQEQGNCERLAVALSDLQAEIYPVRAEPVPITRGLLLDYPMIHLRTAAGRLDLLAQVPGLGRYEDLIEEAESFDFAGLSVAVLTLDQLIRAKSALQDRPKDREYLDQLLALKRLRGES
jgi:hypothetical protein